MNELSHNEIVDLKEQVNNWELTYKCSMAIEDENGIVHLCDSKGNTLIMMNKQTYLECLNWDMSVPLTVAQEDPNALQEKKTP